ncbi:hypothetical protein [Caulobacter endophyticus]|uniref:hypothetical protein n=1 Tax=Caulobacter endophyticus TaxID=2172652 RepID=UPI0018EE4F0A|nr:hypothetical protein [Caulobacter endophyticus]
MQGVFEGREHGEPFQNPCRAAPQRRFIKTCRLGYAPQLDTYIGPETPNPLFISVLRSKEAFPKIEGVLRDIMGLTKINYNACNFNDSIPVTVRFADKVVKARVLRETPTAAYDCGPDRIVMSWPWIVELNVGRVLSGHATTGRLTVLTVQHTHTLRGRQYHLRWLQRNTLGAFNVLSVDPRNPPLQCAADAPPARPYVQPPDGKTLLDLEREGAELSRGSN